MNLKASVRTDILELKQALHDIAGWIDRDAFAVRISSRAKTIKSLEIGSVRTMILTARIHGSDNVKRLAENVARELGIDLTE